MADTPEGAGPTPPPAPPTPPKPAVPKVDPVEAALRAEVPSAALDSLKRAHPDAVQEVTWHAGATTVVVPAAKILEVLRFLHDDPASALTMLTDQTAVDWPKRDKRFDVVYHLYSIPTNQRLRLKVRAGDGESVPSATALFASADWFEREIFDLFGIRFEGHPDLRRIMMPDEWQGHPLRKEFPLEGLPEQHMRLR
jgi:NADH-quinone oxidoreductase subunit C